MTDGDTIFTKLSSRGVSREKSWKSVQSVTTILKSLASPAFERVTDKTGGDR